MSVKEKIQAAQEEAARAEEAKRLLERQQQEEAAKQFYARNDKYHREVHSRRNEQAPLLEELRDTGIVAMIEEVTGQVIESIPVRSQEWLARQVEAHDKELPPPIDRWPTPEEIDENIRRSRETESKEWQVSVEWPELSQESEGIWDTTLRIKATKMGTAFDIRRGRVPRAVVTVTYSPERLLTIEGENKVYSGALPIKSPETQEVLENVMAQAFLHPKKVDSPRRDFRPMFNPHDVRLKANSLS